MSYDLKVKYFEWNSAKNEKLRAERGVSFEEVVSAFFNNKILDVIDNPNEKKYANQMMLVVNIEKYVYLVPTVESEEKYFLKTIFPSRKMTKKYLKN